MKNKKYTLAATALLLFSAFTLSSENKINLELKSIQGKRIFNSTFGEVTSTISKTSGNEFIFTNSGDGFYYKQKLIEKNDTVYSLGVEQKLKVLYFVNKSAKVKYNKPMVRFPKNLKEGMTWSWSGTEFDEENVSSKVEVKSRVENISILKTADGNFNAALIVTEIRKDDGTMNVVKEWIANDYFLLKSELSVNGGGFLGALRDILGYDIIKFELKKLL